MATRRERVILSLQDDFTTGMARAAVATATLDKNLKSLDGSAVRVRQPLGNVDREVDGLGRSSRRTSAEIDTLSGRLSLLVRAGTVVAPALAPIGTVGVAAVAGLSSQLGFAVLGIGSLVAASQGMGDALKAVNDAALEPTEANLAKSQQAMAALSGEAQIFVTQLQASRPALRQIQASAAAGWFPGLGEALGSFQEIAPEVATLFRRIGETGGNLVAEGAAAFAGPEWDDFRAFVLREAPVALDAMGRTFGNVAAGLAELWMAFSPLNRDFNSFLLDSARGFREWAAGLRETDGFNEFIAYVRENGPKVADAFVSIGNAVLQIGEAAAPLGGPVLDGISAIADVIATIADSPIGTPLLTMVTALSAASLAGRGLDAAITGVRGNLDYLGGTGASRVGRLAGTFATVTASATLLQSAMESIFNTRIDAGSVNRDLEALADGRVTSNFKNLYNTFQDIDNLGMAKANPIGWISSWDPTGAEAAQKNIKDIDNALAGLVESGNGEQAAQAFDRLRETATKAGRSTKELKALFPEYGTAVANAGTESQSAAVEANQLAESQAALALKVGDATEAATKSGNAFLSYSDQIAGSKFSLQKYLEAFEAQVRALATFQESIQRLRDRGLDVGVIDQLIAQGPAAAQAVKALADGGVENINRLNSAFRTGQDEVGQLGADAGAAAQKFGTLSTAISTMPKAARVQVRLDNYEAVQARLNELSRSRNVTFSATFKNAYNPKPGSAPGRTGSVPGILKPPGSADGSTVPKDSMPYGDRYPYLLAPGEEVISNRYGQADRHRGLLKAINAGRLADGGTAKGDKYGERVGALKFAGLPSLNLTDMNLKQLNRSLERSKTALERETDQRDELVSKRDAVVSSVTGSLTSDLFAGSGGSAFGSAAGGFAGVLATLNGDISRAQTFGANVNTLRNAGLSGGALDALVSQGTPEQVAQAAQQSPAQLAEFARLFELRSSTVANAAGSAGQGAYGRQIDAATAEVRAVGARIDELAKAIRMEEKENRAAAKKGASSSSRGRKRR